MSEQEIIFYQDKIVLITNTRAVLGSRTYAMSNVTSVTPGVIPADRTLGIVVAVIGALVTGFCGLISLFGLMWLFGGSSNSTSSAIRGNLFIGLFVVLGLLILGLGIFLAIRKKDTYAIRIGSASGESDALASKDYQYIYEVVKAMNQAIIYRG
jgi:hypothetical protein